LKWRRSAQPAVKVEAPRVPPTRQRRGSGVLAGDEERKRGGEAGGQAGKRGEKPRGGGGRGVGGKRDRDGRKGKEREKKGEGVKTGVS
jgi:hypothetical protein